MKEQFADDDRLAAGRVEPAQLTERVEPGADRLPGRKEPLNARGFGAPCLRQQDRDGRAHRIETMPDEAVLGHELIGPRITGSRPPEHAIRSRHS